jgi:uncharacterized OB-fold protein
MTTPADPGATASTTTPAEPRPKPVPSPEGLNADWYGFCRQRELRFQRCGDCGAWRHPPRYRCPTCGSGAWNWEPATGNGVVYSWTVTHQALHPGYAGDVPYAVLVGEMSEGVRLVAGVREIPLTELRLGLPLMVTWERRTDDITLPIFTRPPA